jgi:ParB-like chromosome segregation protein Spo0J
VKVGRNPLPVDDWRSLPVHPLAAVFPMMADDELAELAADIKANGLVHPPMLDAAGKMLVDGRNRLKACELAEVEPRFERLDGQDPVAYIVSVNLARRNLTKGQQAMLRAVAYPAPKRGTHSELTQSTGEFDKALLSRARTVLRDAPHLTDLVLAGKSLNEAYAEAQQRRTEAVSDEKQLARLAAEAPDLLELVNAERLTVSAAIAAHNQRQTDQRQKTEAGRKAAGQLLDFCSWVATIGIAAQYGERGLVTREKIEQLDRAMNLLRQILAGEQGKRDGKTQ